ncbi:hypothetical protein SynBIOSE41_01890 [Synechococcus sp. BIOS-E4-1]|nr:hypothetical protein SynBIOSE41_01890 [Synechococcus sp. BIOS-E4-1]
MFKYLALGVHITPKTAATGAFYFFNHASNPINQSSRPGPIERSEYYPKHLQQTVAMIA